MVLLHCLDSFSFDTVEELFVGGDVVDKADYLASGPYLGLSVSRTLEENCSTYTKVLVSVQEYLTSSLSAYKFSDLLELAGCAGLLDVHGLERDLVCEKSRCVLPTPKDKSGVGFLCVDDGLLDVVVDGCFDSAHEARTHVDTTGTESQRGGQTLTVCETSRRDEWNTTQRLPGSAEQDEVGNVCLANMSSAFEAVNGQEVNAKLDRRLCVSDGGALVQDDSASSLELLDDWSRAVSRRLNNIDLLLDNNASVCGIVRGNHGREEGQVDAKRLVGHRSASSDLFAQVFGCGLGESGKLCYRETVFECVMECQTYYAQSSSVADSGSKLSVSDPLHTTLNNGHCLSVSYSLSMLRQWSYL